MPRDKKGSYGSLTRTLRRAFDTGMPVMGVVVILASVLFIRELRLQLAAVLAGILLVEAGVWKLSQWILPNDRKYVGLRAEGDRFIGLIRQLNEAAIALNSEDLTANRDPFESTREAMHQSVERMAELAGKTADQHSVSSEVAV